MISFCAIDKIEGAVCMLRAATRTAFASVIVVIGAIMGDGGEEEGRHPRAVRTLAAWDQ